MQDVHAHDQKRVLRQERKYGKPSRMAQNSDDHGCSPTEGLQGRSQHEHRQDFRDLPNAHHRHDPIAGDTHTAIRDRCSQETTGPVEVAIMDEGIHKRDQP